MALASLSRFALGLLLVTAAALAPVACGEDAPAAPQELITATVLIEAGPASTEWFELTVDKGVDGYELLNAATSGNIESEWYPAFRSHFVQSIQGVTPEGAEFWGVFLWSETANDGAGAWEPLPIGADLFSVKDGHIMGWALVEYNPDVPQFPHSQPEGWRRR